MSKKKNHYICKDLNCDKEFATMRGVYQHMRIAHIPPPPEPPPKKTTIVAETRVEYGHNLLDGVNLEIGDVFYTVEKCVVIKITKTKGSRDASVDYRVTKQHWTQDKPS